MRVFCIIDGLGDKPCKVLNGKTPLEYARIYNLNYLARNGKTGIVYTVQPNFVPQSDQGVLSLLGYNLDKIYTERGPLEAVGANIEFSNGDLAFRANFATVYKGKLIDRRVGRNLTTKEAEILAKDINRNIKLDIGFEFKHTIEHRAVLVLKKNQGVILNNKVSNVDSEYSGTLNCRALNRNAICTAGIINEFLTKSKELLQDHKINKLREKKGLLAANFILLRGAGNQLPILKKKKNWCAVLNMPLEIGIGRLCGMHILKVPSLDLKRDLYKNLYNKLEFIIKNAKKAIKKNSYDVYYIHFKEIDIPGHDNRPKDKAKMLEILDKKFFSFLKNLKNVEIIVTGDHSTPCELRKHSADPVPILWYGHGNDNVLEFNENSCKNGELGELFGNEVLSICRWE
ncbi:2,3-bisphosphoglycerate-independent phosphoglycerate mutase [Candidatus Woesearchaeota archaeon]|nr:2,3-bisphosphoglycerate-independent phosphoglycerate mutase [Candidatus Woesearchaeota archaeon]